MKPWLPQLPPNWNQSDFSRRYPIPLPTAFKLVIKFLLYQHYSLYKLVKDADVE